MQEIIEEYVKKLFYKKYNLDMSDLVSKMYIEDGILQEVDSSSHKKKKEKRYCATNLMDISSNDIYWGQNKG